MAIFKCKMCGGTIEFEQGATVGVCDSCGTKQTLPRLDDEKRANLYDRANHFRRNNDFDKAAAIYEQILNEDNTDAEAYWSLVLCRYGIEYVEDPATRRRMPTVNRAQFTSIFADEDYKSALQYADGYQKAIYEDEAKAIDEIQKGILEISSKEEPFDIFICYKETDNNGRRTPDSVLANDLYHQLTQEGFKVFFSRITLEDKLGVAYEPYIFAALNSAKVMVVLGTKPEYFNAVWVKNEWSRYLALVKTSGGQKMLIPAYKDMDPYDLPEEFSHLQAQDMSKLGFMQDLIRGIKKIVSVDALKTTPKETVVTGTVAPTAPLLKRAFLFLEDGDFARADEFCEQVLNQDPENAEAYLGKLMAELQVKSRKQLADCAEPFDGKDNYGKVLRFGDEKLRSELQGYIAHICQRKIEEIKAKEEADRRKAARKAEAARIAAEHRAKCIKKIAMIVLPSLCAIVIFAILLNTVIIPTIKYNDAVSLMNEGKYIEAMSAFEALEGYKDSPAKIQQCQNAIDECNTAILEMKYNEAVAFLEQGDIVHAYEKLVELNGYKDSATKANEIFGKYKIEKLKIADVGDIVYFGSYEQDNNKSNGKEDIEWLVLAKEGSRALVISKYALDCQPYNTSYTTVTWEKCTLRTWLNGTFLNNAFSAEEQLYIATTNVSADKNPAYSIDPGNATNDKVFLLSITEAEKYFSSDPARRCSATACAKARGASTGNCLWWLRSPGTYRNYAASVSMYGSFHYEGDTVDTAGACVRPALWIDLGD